MLARSEHPRSRTDSQTHPSSPTGRVISFCAPNTHAHRTRGAPALLAATFGGHGPWVKSVQAALQGCLEAQQGGLDVTCVATCVAWQWRHNAQPQAERGVCVFRAVCTFTEGRRRGPAVNDVDETCFRCLGTPPTISTASPQRTARGWVRRRPTREDARGRLVTARHHTAHDTTDHTAVSHPVSSRKSVPRGHVEVW